MGVVVRPKSKPVNRPMILAALCGTAAWLSWPEGGSYWQEHAFFWMSTVCAGASALGAVRGLIDDYRLRKNIAISEQVSENHGSAREATRAEVIQRGMGSASGGDLLGLDAGGEEVRRPLDAPFGYFEGPPGTGKSSFWVTGSVLNRAMCGYSIQGVDPKCELGPMLIPGLVRLGFEVHAINPARQYIDIVGSAEHHPYELLVDALYAEGDQRKDAVKIAADYANIHYPDSSDAKNPYFVQGSRRAMVIGMLSNLLRDPTRGTPTDLSTLLGDPARFVKQLRFIATEMESFVPDDPVLAFLKVEAKNLLHRNTTNEENFGAFLEGATQRLLSWNQAGRLGGYGRNPTFKIADMRKRQVIVFVMTPLSHKREFADFISLLNYNVVAACKAKPNGHKLHIVAEEALNYRFDNLVSDLETLRGLGVTADFYVQSYPGLEKMYGREGAAAIISYCDVQVFTGLTHDRAKQVSEMLSDMTIRQQEFSYQANAKEVGISSREIRRPMMKSDEVRAMKPGTAWAFVRGIRPKRLRLVDYGRVSPWRDWVSPSPITGTKLYGDPLITIDYSHWRKPNA